MREKVKIVLSDSGYTSHERMGEPFVAVDYNGRLYGGGSPCDTEEDIQRAIQNAKETIIEKGDIPIVEDQRERKGLLRWM